MDRYSLRVTLEEANIPELRFYDVEDAYTWYHLLQSHPHVTVIQLFEDGQRRELWYKDGLSTINLLKVLGM